MIVYVALEVQLHGLERPSLDGLVAEVRRLLEPSFGRGFSSDIEIEIIEHAGQAEAEGLEIMREMENGWR